MARPWVAIEADLADHPKIRQIAKASNRHPFFCVGALARVWGECVKFGEMDGDDMVLRGRDIYAIDKVADRRGFAGAMIAAGWLKVVDAETLRFPALTKPLFFESIITQKVRAKEAERKRQKRRGDSASRETSADSPANVLRHNIIDKNRDTSYEVSTPLPPILDTPQFRSAWTEWESHRKHKRSALTPEAVRRQLKKLEAIGHDRAIAAIEHSIAQGYQGIYEAGGGAGGGGSELRPGKVRSAPGKYASVDAKARALGAGQLFRDTTKPADVSHVGLGERAPDSDVA